MTSSPGLMRRALVPAVSVMIGCSISHAAEPGAAGAGAKLALPPPLASKVDYVQDVKPLLVKHCYECHGDGKQQSGLRLDLRQNALRGGDYGPVIIPGKSAESKLIHKLLDGDGGDVMPPEGDPLTAAEISLLRAWIDQGADFRNEVRADAPPKPIDPVLAEAIAAVRSRDHAKVATLLRRQPDLAQATDPAKSTLLHHAAGFGTIETLQLLLDAGADVKAKNARGSTPLHWAIPEEKKVRLLLAHGADVNGKIADGRTPLYLATYLGNGQAVIRLLLEKGANPNLRVGGGRTPLMVAAGRGDTEAMRLLLDAQAAVDTADSAGNTALMSAAANGTPAAVRLLLQRGADARAHTKRDETALGNAGTAGNLETVRLLVEHGAEINTRNIRGYSPLMLAASSDTRPADVVQLLLEKGADASYTGDYDETARDLAAKRGPTAVARLLGATAPDDAEKVGKAARRKMNSIPVAVERALALTEKQSHEFIRVAGCNSCHSQDLPSAAAGLARSRGLNAPREISQLPASAMPSPERVMDLDFVTVGSKAWETFDFGMNQASKTAYTDAIARLVMATQMADGHWEAGESRRPPMATGEFQTAALAMYTLRHYAPEGHTAAANESLARAAKWLARAKPETTQDRAFHLLGLAWGGTKPEAEAVRALIALQRKDGGWSQLPELESDAYAAGQVLYALIAAGGISSADPVMQKGISYLLRSQAEDGSWHVKTRAIWLQPYFESGFPYGRDQFISTAGTAWAAMALAAAQPSPVALR